MKFPQWFDRAGYRDLVCEEFVETDLVPYQARKPPKAQRVLVFAPHPDDEVFGCGGALALHAMDGVSVQIIVVTDGGRFGSASVRAKESAAAAVQLGYGSPEHWDYADRGARCEANVVERVRSRIASSGADLVYAPSPWEVHPDHRQVSAVVWSAAIAVDAGVRVAFYEVGAPLVPNRLVDISAVWGQKAAAMNCFTSQLTQQDYAAHIEALNRYRTYTVGASCTHAEAFLVTRPRRAEQAAFDEILNRRRSRALARPES
jgi:O-antigen biosynthesis protein